jgi:hypothetical protein
MRSSAGWLRGVSFALLSFASAPVWATLGAILDNGTVQLGVHGLASLIVPGGTDSGGPNEITDVGLRLIEGNWEGLAPGDPCEGWGLGDTVSQTSGFADLCGTSTASPVSFRPRGAGTLEESTGSAVRIVNRISGDVPLEVRHDFHPSVSPNLYEIGVEVVNQGEATATLVYRRIMDWDVEPTAFSEFVTLELGESGAVVFSNNNGFAGADPLLDPNPDPILSPPVPCGVTTDFTDCGPADHGALLDFGLGDLAPGETVAFRIFYGAAPTEAAALAALAAVGAEAWSLAQCDGEGDVACDETTGAPVTFLFGFRSGPSSLIFADDFELGDPCGWSGLDETSACVF